MAKVFHPELVKHLAASVNVPQSKLMEAIEQYFNGSDEKKSSSSSSEDTNVVIETKSEVAETSTPKTRSYRQKHRCERIPNGKTTQCGKSAPRSLIVDGVEKWFCGTSQAGCYRCMERAMMKNNSIQKTTTTDTQSEKIEKKEKKTEKKVKEKDVTPAERSEEKVKSLIDRVVGKKKQLRLIEMKIDDRKVYVDKEKKIVFDLNSGNYEALGAWDGEQDENKIIELNSEQIRYLDSMSLKVRDTGIDDDSESDDDDPLNSDNESSDDDEEDSDGEDSEDDL